MKMISKEFAPPLKLISPFFRMGALFYLISMFALLFFEPVFSYLQFNIAGWIHLFLLGFVMMIIFGAMAQLVPVVLEVGHVAVDLYYVILPSLVIGTLVMVSGFWVSPTILSYGGLIVLMSMMIFTIENIVTLRKTQLKSLTVSTVKWSNGFLFLGIVLGLFIAFGFNEGMNIDAPLIVKGHVFTLLGGYIFLTIMGFSLVLLPMFSLAHGFKETYIHIAFILIITGVSLVFIGAIFGLKWIISTGYFLNFLGCLFYIWQILLIAKLTVRKEMDIWSRSMIFSFVSLIITIILGTLYLVVGSESILHAALWFFLTGFISFFILGHLYKIVPFLVWFERFSPLVGKEKVPMLHEMYPKDGASMMFWFSTTGVVITGSGLLFENILMFKAGGSFLFIGAIFVNITMHKMLAFGK